MSELMRLIQAHLDKYGVSRAEFARRAGTTPQTVQNWKNRPGTLPKPEHLRGVADVIGVPFQVVLNAALADAGYSRDESEVSTPRSGLRAAITRSKLKIQDGDERPKEA